MSRILKIGTRGSPLALKQTQMVERALKNAHPDIACELMVIKTSGDWSPGEGETRLAEREGGKGLFIKEIEAGLLDGRIDCAVHSMKDVPSFLPDGVGVDHVLPRADARDALICFSAKTIEDLREGAVVGTSSLRRQSFALNSRPDLSVTPLRGNVQTRLDKIRGGQADATFLAMAGLNRLEITGDFIHPLPVDVFVPACGQGIIAIETRFGDQEIRGLLDAVHDTDTGLCAAVERAALQELDGSCHTPIGAHAAIKDGVLSFILAVGAADGSALWEEGAVQPVRTIEEARAMGGAIAKKLKTQLPPGALD